jgi:hypothetical protein
LRLAFQIAAAVPRTASDVPFERLPIEDGGE